ncbi:DnaA ATPase domain-containing protein [Vibrio cholerae]
MANDVFNSISSVEKFNPYASRMFFKLATQPPSGQMVFIYGPSGSGKSYFVQKLKHLMPNKNVLIFIAEDWVNQLVEALKTSEVEVFYSKLTGKDCLIIEDIQFLAYRERSQREMLVWIKRAISSGINVVITSNCPPTHLEGFFDSHLKSRLCCGDRLPIHSPSFEAKYDFVINYLNVNSINVHSDAISLICNDISTNYYELVGILSLVKSFYNNLNVKVDREHLRLLLSEKYSGFDRNKREI